jgi:hypothetical protein
VQHERTARPGPIGELDDQPRLPDAGLTGDDHDLGGAVRGTGQRVIERIEFQRSPDEFRSRDRARHRGRVYAEHVLRYPPHAD